MTVKPSSVAPTQWKVCPSPSLPPLSSSLAITASYCASCPPGSSTPSHTAIVLSFRSNPARLTLPPGGLPTLASALPAGAEPARAPSAPRQRQGLDHLHRRQLDQQQLGDAVARVHGERLLGVGVEQQHPDLAPVAAIDETRGVDQGDAMPRGQSRSGEHQPGVARRDLQG